jgi:hypothetical protein
LETLTKILFLKLVVFEISSFNVFHENISYQLALRECLITVQSNCKVMTIHKKNYGHPSKLNFEVTIIFVIFFDSCLLDNTETYNINLKLK